MAGSPTETWAQLLAATPKDSAAYKDYEILSKEQGAGGSAVITPYAADIVGHQDFSQLVALTKAVDANYKTPHPDSFWSALLDVSNNALGPYNPNDKANEGSIAGGTPPIPTKSSIKKTLSGDTSALTNVLSSPWGWLKELFSAQLWDRILFVLGGAALVAIAIVLMLHKSIPTPL